MSDAKHTPGPWKIEYAETGVRWPVIYVDDGTWDAGRRQLADLHNYVAKRGKGGRWRKTPDAEEAEANAALIASAPDLAAERDRLRAELAEAVDVLREVQWTLYHPEESSHVVYQCPECVGDRDDGAGHRADCRLDAFLNRNTPTNDQET